MTRALVVAATGAAIVLGGLSGCSSGKKSETESEATRATTSVAASPSVGASTAAGTVTVTIDGKPKDIQGQVVCATAGGTFTIGVGDQATGIAVVMSEDASKVTSVGLGNVDGAALGFQDGMPGGSATATKDGKTYTISGTATGVDMANPMQPMTKPFEVSVTCP